MRVFQYIALLLSLQLAACGGGGSGDIQDTVSQAANQPSGTNSGAGTNMVAGVNCMLTDAELALLEAHNAARSQTRQCRGVIYPAVAPLTWSCALGQAAKNHSSDMATNNFFNHTGSDGLGVGDRANNEGYQFRAIGENIAAGQTSVDQVLQSWLNSPSGHCENIMNANYTNIGATRVDITGSDFPVYWTTVFGTPR